MVKIAPSLLGANFMNLEKELKAIEKAGAEWLHYDVMDGHFVPNLSFGYSILKDIKEVTNLYLDVHLMITNPQDYVDSFIRAGAQSIVFHVEAMENMEAVKSLVTYIQSQNIAAGISIKPKTAVVDIASLLPYVDMVLVMSIEPGFGGQTFMPMALDKISLLKQLRSQYGYSFLIEVDGGVNEETGRLCKEAGVDVLVAGSYIFNAEDYQIAIGSLL